MNSFLPPNSKNDDVEVSTTLEVGSMALFFSLVIVALAYLSNYSMGSDFSDQAPNFRDAIVATSAP